MFQKVILILCFSMCIITACDSGKPELKIGYLQIADDPGLNSAKEGFIRALTDSGFVDGENIKIIDNNANGDLSMIISMLQSLKSQKVNMVVTNGTPCMVSAAQIITDIPIVFTVSFSPEQVGLKTTPENLHGVFDPFDTESFVSMVMKCMPSLKTVGLPFNNSEPNAEYSANKIIQSFEKVGVQVVTTSVTSANDILIAGQYLTTKRVDALVVGADNTVNLGLNALAKIAGETKTPLFVTEPFQAKKGAAVGLGVNYEQWGYLSGVKAVHLLKNGRVSPKIEAITELKLYINEEASKTQGLTIPQSIRNKY